MRKELTFREALRVLKEINGEYSYLSIEQAIHNYKGLETKLCEWLQNHTQKTRKQDFLEKYPDAPMLDGKPTFCCRNIGYVISDKDCCGQDCSECWNTPIDEEAIK